MKSLSDLISLEEVSLLRKRIEPISDRNSPQRKIDLDALKRDVEKYPDLYMYERAKKLLYQLQV